MAKHLPNIGKPVPEMTDPANIKVVSDAIEALDTALGAKPSTLTTTAKTLVPAINEVRTKIGADLSAITTRASGTSVVVPAGIHFVLLFNDPNNYLIAFVNVSGVLVEIEKKGLTSMTYTQATRTFEWTYSLNMRTLSLA